MQVVPAQNFAVFKVALILALGAFAMANAKVSMTLLIPVIADDLQVTEYLVLNTVWAYFLGAIIGAPVLALLCRNLSKHQNLIFLSVWCFLGNLLTSFAWNLEVLYWLRFFSGLPHGAFVAFAILYIAQISPVGMRSWYIGLVMIGGAVATVLASPINGWIADQYSWQTAFRFVALCDVLMALLIHDLLPKTHASTAKQTIQQQLQSVRHHRLWLLLIIEVAIMAIVSAIWTSAYAVMYEKHSDWPLDYAIIIALVLGIGFLGGQVVGAYLSHRNSHRGIMQTCWWAILACGFLWVFSGNVYLVLAGLMLLSSLTMINIILQVRLLEIKSGDLYLVFCLFHSALHVGNVVGSGGSYAIMQAKQGLDGVLLACASLAALSLLIWWYLNRDDANASWASDSKMS